MPLINAATLSGIISRLGAVPVLRQMRRTTGMKIATTAVEFINAPSHHQHQQQHEEPCSAGSRRRVQPVAEPPGHACPHQTFTDYEQRRDKHDVRVAEAGRSLVHIDDAVNGITAIIISATASMWAGRQRTSRSRRRAEEERQRDPWSW
jgi:hypothetical protein